MTFVAVDIGNSFTKIRSVHSNRKKQFYYSFATGRLLAGDETIADDLRSNLASVEKGYNFWIASVVPKASEALATILIRTYPESIVHLLENSEVPIINRYKDPDQAGIDRLLAACAAHKKYDSPLIVISFGTATTIDCVSREGEFLGGIIAPGIFSGAKMLHTSTAQLPEVPLQFPKHMLGKTTIHSIQSGVMFGAVEMIDGLVGRLKNEVFPKKKVNIITTGNAASKEFLKRISGGDYHRHLVLEGIVETIHMLNER